MPAGSPDAPWFIDRLALVLEPKGAAVENGIMKTICPEEFLELRNLPPGGVGGPLERNSATRIQNKNSEVQETVYQDKGLLAHVLKAAPEVRP